MFESIFRLYNYLGILSVKVDKNNVIRVSTFITIINMSRILASLIVLAFIMNSSDFRKAVMKNQMLSSNSYSKFSKIIGIVAGMFFNFSVLALCLIQFLRREKIIGFLNEVNRSRIDKSKFWKFWKKQFILALTSYIFINTFQIRVKVKLTFLSIVSFIVLVEPYLYALGFMSFVKTFEYFFVFCLKDFKLSLMTFKFKQNNDNKLIQEYRNIYVMNQSFKSIFGMQITFIVCGVAGFITINVCV